MPDQRQEDGEHPRRRRKATRWKCGCPVRLNLARRFLAGLEQLKLSGGARRSNTSISVLRPPENLFRGRPPLSEIYSDLILARLMPSGAVHTNRTARYRTFGTAWHCRQRGELADHAPASQVRLAKLTEASFDNGVA
jgi:hypothetical protein